MDVAASTKTVYQKRGGAFPRTSFLLSIASATLLYWFGGIPKWGAVAFAAVQFSLMGGFKFYKLFYKTFPRDIRLIMNGIKMMLAIKRKVKQTKMTTEFLTETVKKYPNKTAIISIGLDGDPDRTLTFLELEAYINKIANYFRSRGLKKGDSIALFLENSPESFVLYLGLAKIGVISALININLRRESLLHCIKVSDCVGLVFSASLSDAISEVLPELDSVVREACYYVCGESSVKDAKNLAVELESVSKEQPPPLKGKSVDDTILYVYTSGTTGMPKACRVDDSKLYKSIKFFGVAGHFSENDCTYCILPLYHSHGLIHCGGTMIYNGCTVVIRKKFSARNFWTDCAKYNCTLVFTIGEISRYLVAQPPRPTDTQHKVRLTVTAGLRKEIWLEYQKRFNMAQIFEFYACTEGNIAFFNLGDKPGAIGSVSLLFPSFFDVHMIKLDPETGDYIKDENGFYVDSGLDEPGEMISEITKRFPYFGYRDEGKSAKKVLTNVFKKGDSYFRSGDIMRIDEEGWVFFCDRSGDTYRWKGENVSTAEVECRIGCFLELTDVVVYGVEVPGNEGRAGMAAIVGTPDTIDLAGLPQQLFLSLPHYAVPLFVRLIKAAYITGTFKLQKVKLRNEGFDRDKVSDPLYMLKGKSYVPLTEELYQEVLSGNAHV